MQAGAVALVGFIRELTAIATMIQEKHAIVTRRHKVVGAQLRRGGKGKADKFYAKMNKLEMQEKGLQRDQVNNAAIR